MTLGVNYTLREKRRDTTVLIRNIMAAGVIVGVLFSVALTGCGTDSGTNTGANVETGTLSLRITDTPYPLDLIDEVRVTISEIKVHVSDSPTEDSEFLTIPMDPPKTFNLLDLRGGVTESLVNAELSEGTYGQIRLVVSSAYIKLKDGREPILDMPSAGQSGIKIFPNPPITVTGGLTTEIILDFDVGQSFLPIPAAPQKASEIERFKFHPVIRVANSTSMGRISGTVTNQDDASPIEDATLTAFEGTVQIASTPTDSDGNYVLSGLTAGTYDVTASHSTFVSSIKNNVAVVSGNETGGTDFSLTPQP